MNTKEHGIIKFFIYRDKGDSHYTAVCLSFDIIEHGTNLEELKSSIEEAARLHLESVRENNLDDKLLNRSAPQKYWKKLYDAMVKSDQSEQQETKIKEVPSVSDIWNRSSKELVLA